MMRASPKSPPRALRPLWTFKSPKRTAGAVGFIVDVRPVLTPSQRPLLALQQKVAGSDSRRCECVFFVCGLGVVAGCVCRGLARTSEDSQGTPPGALTLWGVGFTAPYILAHTLGGCNARPSEQSPRGRALRPLMTFGRAPCRRLARLGSTCKSALGVVLSHPLEFFEHKGAGSNRLQGRVCGRLSLRSSCWRCATRPE